MAAPATTPTAEALLIRTHQITLDWATSSDLEGEALVLEALLRKGFLTKALRDGGLARALTGSISRLSAALVYPDLRDDRVTIGPDALDATIAPLRHYRGRREAPSVPVWRWLAETNRAATPSGASS